MQHSIPVGPFDLLHIVGKGGMGEVWEGVHREQGVPVAVKVITATSARQSRYLEAFRNEVRAVARLDHPGIVWVLDYGTIPGEAEEASKGAMVAGSPYLTMEYASGGTLHGVMAELDWVAVKRVLLELLDALAHAHARGVVHRDLKPGNVLLARTTDVRPGLKLTDFGIARAIDFKPEEIGSKPLGTLHYMAPEQVRAEWQEQGPWTDLYAVGCMAYRFVAGHLPFQGKRAAALMHAQVRKMPPRPTLRFDAPPEVLDWVWTLIAKDPHERFRSAADAAHALLSIPDPFARETLDIGSLASQVSSTTVDRLQPLELTSLVSEELSAAQAQSSDGDEASPRTHLHLVRPPQPRTWRRPIPTRPSPKLLGAGLGLWGIRTVPLVGRERDRDTLWNAMRDVRRNKRPRVAVIRGHTGTGKTRLAEWIGQRVEEVGSAMALHGRCSRGAPVGHGVRDLFARALRTTALAHDDFLDRIDSELEPRGMVDELERMRVAALCAPEGTLPDVPLDNEARQEVAAKTLRLLTKERPVYLWFDDAHHDPDTLSLTKALLAHDDEDSPLPMLIVLVVRDEDLAESDLKTELEALQAHEDTIVIELEDLKRSHRAVLVRELLGLSPMLAAQVEQRTAGNPLFTTQLVNQWVEADQLIVGPDGFRLRDPDQFSLPQTLDEVWVERLDRLLGDLPPEATNMLRFAAVLGAEVDVIQWSRVCDAPSTAKPGQVYFHPEAARIRHEIGTRLLDASLAEETDDGWRFTHGMLREAILAGAREAGVLERMHRAAATMLEVHGDGPADEERRALHLMSGGRALEAIPLLLRAIEHRSGMSLPAALELVARTETALRQAGVPPEDIAWARVVLARCHVIARLGRHEQATGPLDDLARLASLQGWEHLGFEARLARLELGVALEEVEVLSHALALRDDLEAHGTDVQRARVLTLLAKAYDGLGELDNAFAAASELVALTADEDELVAARGWSLLGRLCLAKEELTEALGLLTHAVRVYREHPGNAIALAETLTYLGQVHAERGQLGRAQRSFTEAVRLYRRTGSGEEGLALIALGELLLLRESWRDALLVWTHATRAVGDRPAPSLQLHCHVGLAASAAGLKDWAGCARHLANGERASEQLGAFTDRRTAPMLLETAYTLNRRKRIDLAHRAIRLARRLFRVVGDTDALNRVDAIIEGWAST